jgi:coatomer protein complex subunit alpha (xenin)
MLVRFESKSARVKGISFHPKRPWVAASLHNGSIQIWDYRMSTLIDKFEEHEGPVRGVDFHKVQPLLVSGGDDYKVKVWDYQTRKCLYTLLGHMDYIRTVEFHPEYPWILSASDDQTIRIWNWQSRTCIAVLTGHNHYVMSARFHPKEDLIVSASLDQTVRVWDTTGLRRKTVKGIPSRSEDSLSDRVNSDLFGGTDAVVKYVLEGHDRGVNWASFHPSLPYIISGADDRHVKLWRMNDTSAWEVDTLRGHLSNVSCVVFHPKRDWIISNSEDKSIRVWDLSKRTVFRTIRRETERFWVLAVHPTQNLIAAGHDGGMVVFKLERERPALDVYNGKLFYVKDRYVRLHDFERATDSPLATLSYHSSSSTSSSTDPDKIPRYLSVNPFNNNQLNVLVCSNADGGSYQLITSASHSSNDSTDIRTGLGLSAVFVARNRIAVLERSRVLTVKDLSLDPIKRFPTPVTHADMLFFGGMTGRVIVRGEDTLTLFDTQSKQAIGSVQAPQVKYVSWSQDFSFVALLSKHTITLCDRNFNVLCSHSETVRVKSGAWDLSRKPLFIYSTLTHVKYLLSNGDFGIIRAIELPIYITLVAANELYYLSREGTSDCMQIDLSEALFKLALEERNYPEVMNFVTHSNISGNAVIDYLQKKGFPEVALHFVRDKARTFDLALSCGNIETALEAAHELNSADYWKRIAEEALRQGNHEVVEMAYQKTKSFDRLSFLYLLTGNTDKLRKMLKISNMLGDVMGRFHNSLFLGDVEERVRVLEETGQFSLAYVTARTHGLEEQAGRLEEVLLSKELPIPSIPEPNQSRLLQPPTPILRMENWPLLDVERNTLERQAERQRLEMMNNAKTEGSSSSSSSAFDQGSGWDMGSDLEEEEEKKRGHAFLDQDIEAGGAWSDDGLDFDDEDEEEEKQSHKASLHESLQNGGGSSSSSGIPKAGVSKPSLWIQNSSHAPDHIAAGALSSAGQLLNRQIALVNFSPLRSHFLNLFSSSSLSLPGFPLTPSSKFPLVRDHTSFLPKNPLTVNQLQQHLSAGYMHFTRGEFDASLEAFRSILRAIPLASAPSRSDTQDLKEMLPQCKEYITANRLKILIDSLSPEEDPVRVLELSAMLTHCNLQPAHLILVLKIAMISSFKLGNFILALEMSRRLLELPDVQSEKHADLRKKAQKVMKKSEKEGRNEHVINYDENSAFNIDCLSFFPIPRELANEALVCPYCSSAHLVGGGEGETSQTVVCATCELCQVGEKTVGLVTSNLDVKK